MKAGEKSISQLCVSLCVFFLQFQTFENFKDFLNLWLKISFVFSCCFYFRFFHRCDWGNSECPHISNTSNVGIVALNTWCQWIALLSISSANDWRADTLKHSCVAHSTIRMHELKTKQFVCYVDMKSTQSLIDLEINSKNLRTSLPSLRKYFHTEIHFDDICKLCGFVIRSF